MNKISINDYELLTLDCEEATLVFTMAKNDFNFNKILKQGENNLRLLKEHFNLKEIGFTDQYHSDKVIIYNHHLEKGDAVITNEKKIGIGVFTADCVPVLLFDRENKVIAAIHSGWRGTLNLIVYKTIEMMKKKFETKGENIIACVGPHIKQCCFEVGQEVIKQFKESEFYKGYTLNKGRNLDLENCIKLQLIKQQVALKNIKAVDKCTFCDKEKDTFSYRRGDTDKRLFSLIFMK